MLQCRLAAYAIATSSTQLTATSDPIGIHISLWNSLMCFKTCKNNRSLKFHNSSFKKQVKFCLGTCTALTKHAVVYDWNALTFRTNVLCQESVMLLTAVVNTYAYMPLPSQCCIQEIKNVTFQLAFWRVSVHFCLNLCADGTSSVARIASASRSWAVAYMPLFERLLHEHVVMLTTRLNRQR